MERMSTTDRSRTSSILHPLLIVITVEMKYVFFFAISYRCDFDALAASILMQQTAQVEISQQPLSNNPTTHLLSHIASSATVPPYLPYLTRLLRIALWPTRLPPYPRTPHRLLHGPFRSKSFSIIALLPSPCRSMGTTTARLYQVTCLHQTIPLLYR